jgi:hypothetical protein
MTQEEFSVAISGIAAILACIATIIIFTYGKKK